MNWAGACGRIPGGAQQRCGRPIRPKRPSSCARIKTGRSSVASRVATAASTCGAKFFETALALVDRPEDGADEALVCASHAEPAGGRSCYRLPRAPPALQTRARFLPWLPILPAPPAQRTEPRTPALLPNSNTHFGGLPCRLSPPLLSLAGCSSRSPHERSLWRLHSGAQCPRLCPALPTRYK